MMKPIILGVFFLMLTATISSFAQKNNVQSAAKAIGLTTIYMRDGSSASGIVQKDDEMDLEDAKKLIDLAAQHPTTSNDVKMWYYRGRIYLLIYQKNKGLDNDAIKKAIESFTNCINVDDKKALVDSARVNLMTSAVLCFDEGGSQFSNKNYDKALELYKLVLDVFPYDTNKDLVRNNVSDKTIYLYSFYAANAKKDNRQSKIYLNKLMEMGYNDPVIYLEMINICLQEKDTGCALNYVEKGREKFNDNKDLIEKQVALYAITGKIDALLLKLNDDISDDPYNGMLFLVRAKIYENQGNTGGAEQDYLKSIELNPNSFDGNYGLGAMYYNQGAVIINAAKDIADNNKYMQEKKKAEDKFSKAIPYLEAAHELNAKDINTLSSLKVLYARTGNNDKFNEIKEKLDQVAGGK